MAGTQDIFIKYNTYNVITDTLYYKILPHSADWIIEKNLIENAAKSILVHQLADEEKSNSVKIAVEKLGINISNYEKNRDSVIRTCFVKLNIIVYNQLLRAENFSIEKTVQDTLRYGDIEKLNKTDYQFAMAEIPPKKLTLFERIIEPAIAVVAIATTTFLFFTVRSQ